MLVNAKNGSVKLIASSVDSIDFDLIVVSVLSHYCEAASGQSPLGRLWLGGETFLILSLGRGLDRVPQRLGSIQDRSTFCAPIWLASLRV